MSKITKFFNNLMWSMLYILPLVLYIGVCIHNGAITDFNAVFTTIGIDFTQNNVVYTAFNDMFGANGVMPLFTGTGVLVFATYYACCYLVHFVCDVLLWLVKWAHNLMNKEGSNL